MMVRGVFLLINYMTSIIVQQQEVRGFLFGSEICKIKEAFETFKIQ
jgi:hypothetical protein